MLCVPWVVPRIPFDAGVSNHYSESDWHACVGEEPVRMELRNLRVAPVARLIRLEHLNRPTDRRHAEFSVAGMVCALGSLRVRRALEGLRGVSAAEVSLERERALVDYDPQAVTIPQMVEAIQHSVVLPRLRRVIERTAHARPDRRAKWFCRVRPGP